MRKHCWLGYNVKFLSFSLPTDFYFFFTGVRKRIRGVHMGGAFKTIQDIQGFQSPPSIPELNLSLKMRRERVGGFGLIVQSVVLRKPHRVYPKIWDKRIDGKPMLPFSKISLEISRDVKMKGNMLSVLGFKATGNALNWIVEIDKKKLETAANEVQWF